MAYIGVNTDEYIKNFLDSMPNPPEQLMQTIEKLHSVKGVTLKEAMSQVGTSVEEKPFDGQFYDDGYMLLANTFIPMTSIKKVTFEEYQTKDWDELMFEEYQTKDWDYVTRTYWCVSIDYGGEIYTSGRYSTMERARAKAQEIMSKAIRFIIPNIQKPVKEIACQTES